PDIVPPSVTVTAKYTGANAEVATKAVAMPLERAINGVRSGVFGRYRNGWRHNIGKLRNG
ncbi:MAG: hypothetical protein EOO39_50815, partial [Cytophagaceae bacterium]